MTATAHRLGAAGAARRTARGALRSAPARRGHGRAGRRAARHHRERRAPAPHRARPGRSRRGARAAVGERRSAAGARSSYSVDRRRRRVLPEGVRRAHQRAARLRRRHRPRVARRPVRQAPRNIASTTRGRGSRRSARSAPRSPSSPASSTRTATSRPTSGSAPACTASSSTTARSGRWPRSTARPAPARSTSSAPCCPARPSSACSTWSRAPGTAPTRSSRDTECLEDTTNPGELRDVGCELVFDVTEPSLLAMQIAPATTSGAIIEERLEITDGHGGKILPSAEVAAEHGGRIHLVPAAPGMLSINYTRGTALLCSTRVRSWPRPRRRDHQPGGGRRPPAESLLPLGRARGLRRHRVRRRRRRQSRGGRAPGRVVGVRTPRVRRQGAAAPSTLRSTRWSAARASARDFAQLAITLCRALGVPARLAAVYAPGLAPMDFHAVVEVLTAAGWQVLDPTRLAPDGRWCGSLPGATPPTPCSRRRCAAPPS